MQNTPGVELPSFAEVCTLGVTLRGIATQAESARNAIDSLNGAEGLLVKSIGLHPIFNDDAIEYISKAISSLHAEILQKATDLAVDDVLALERLGKA